MSDSILCNYILEVAQHELFVAFAVSFTSRAFALDDFRQDYIQMEVWMDIILHPTCIH